MVLVIIMAEKFDETNRNERQRNSLKELLDKPENFRGQKLTVTGSLEDLEAYPVLGNCSGAVVRCRVGYLKTEDGRLYFDLAVPGYAMPSTKLEILDDCYKNQSQVTLQGTVCDFHVRENRYRLSVHSVVDGS